MSIHTGTEIENNLAVPLQKQHRACARKAGCSGRAETEAISLRNAETPVPIEILFLQRASKEPFGKRAATTKRIAACITIEFLEGLA
jgi:hypothetical protein